MFIGRVFEKAIYVGEGGQYFGQANDDLHRKQDMPQERGDLVVN